MDERDDTEVDDLSVLEELTPFAMPDRETQWLWLLDGLGVEGDVRQVAADRIEVDVEQPAGGGPRYAPTITVIVTADQWEDVLVHVAGIGDAGLYLGELLGPRDPEETFVVYFKGRLEMSTREAVPPVRGRAEERWFADLKARADADGTELGWFA